jgi:hypothetical protein
MPIVYLRHVSTGKVRPAEFRPLAPADLDAMERDWRPLLVPTREGDAHWNWRLKEAILGSRPGFESYVIGCVSETVSLHGQRW